MKLQELVNKLSNLLATSGSEAEVKIDNKNIETVTIDDIDGVKTITIASTEGVK